MWGIAGKGKSFIGVDFEGRFIKAAQLERPAPAAARLTAALRLPRRSSGGSLDRQEAMELAGALARQGFAGNRLVVAVPEDKLVTGMLELPPRSSGAPVDEIARTELADMHGYEPHAAEMTCWDLPASGRAKEATQAMAVACRHADADAILEALDAAGLEAAALDTRLHALVRACRPLLSESGITAILDLEWDRAVLILLYQGTVVYRWMMAEAAMRLLSKVLAESLNMEADWVDSFLGEVGLGTQATDDGAPHDAAGAMIRKHLDTLASAMESPFSYSSRLYQGAALESVLLTGCGSGIPGVAEYLQAPLGTKVRTVRPADIASAPRSLGEKSADPSLVVAVGLAQFCE